MRRSKRGGRMAPLLLSSILIFIASFNMAFFMAPIFIRKLKKAGYTVKDMYKPHQPEIPTMGGLLLLASILNAIIVSLFLVESVEKLLLFYFIVFVFGVFGLVDDLLDIGRGTKVFAPYFLALPIAILNLDTSLSIPFTHFSFELGAAFSFIIAPVYVMVVSNLVNMHSGFNGLQTGLTTIAFSFAILNAYLLGQFTDIMYLLPVFAASIAFLLYNRYPAQIFEGNTGSMLFGAALGSFLILANMEIFGLILLFPHIVNFLMYMVWRIKKVGEVKFGLPRKDGTIEVPNALTLKWVAPYYFRLTEVQSTYIMYAVSILFGFLALALA
jgi:UDP-N-acetylglucosamine--dolichyl-phosphate N-acetylglucosaminephosphotransferase